MFEFGGATGGGATGHAGHEPPQSIPVSSPFFILSEQVGQAGHLDPPQSTPVSSPFFILSEQVGQAGHFDPPQSTPVSSPFIILSVQVGEGVDGVGELPHLLVSTQLFGKFGDWQVHPPAGAGLAHLPKFGNSSNIVGSEQV